MVHRTDTETLSAHVHQFTQGGATAYTDEWQGYCGLNRLHSTVCHGKRQWATDADADGIREVHNTIEGIWTTVGNFIRPFRGDTRSFLPAILPYVSVASTQKSSRRRLSQNSSLALILKMSQLFIAGQK